MEEIRSHMLRKNKRKRGERRTSRSRRINRRRERGYGEGMKEIELGWRGEGAEIERQREIETVRKKEKARESRLCYG